MIFSEKAAELQYIIRYAKEEEDATGEISMAVLHCLWVAYCLHHNLDVDTATYDNDILHLWESLTEIGVSMSFTEFDNAMAEDLC